MTVLGSLQHLRRSISEKFGPHTANWHLLITSSQFHIMFYASRPLPNVFALALALIAVSYWLRGKTSKFILTSAFVILVFRAELALLLGTMLLMDLTVGRISLLKTIGFGLLGLILSLAITISIDSWFWQKSYLWPEGMVLYYNVILNKSSNWGTSPWPWYFYSALPRAMFTSLIFVPIGAILDRRTLLLIIPSFTFVFLYSFLPHKELRFIIYVFPMLNIVAAEACKRLLENATKKSGIFRKLLALTAILHLFANAIFSIFMLYISSHNYPGGEAMMKLHQIEPFDKPLNVHIDVYAAQTGVSRFLQMNSNWTYNKTEDLSNENLKTFTHLIMESKNEETLEFLKKSHEIIAEIEAFKGLKVNWKLFPPVKCNFVPAVTILRKKRKT